jgi:hypothetical protein
VLYRPESHFHLNAARNNYQTIERLFATFNM